MDEPNSRLHRGRYDGVEFTRCSVSRIADFRYRSVPVESVESDADILCATHDAQSVYTIRLDYLQC